MAVYGQPTLVMDIARLSASRWALLRHEILVG